MKWVLTCEAHLSGYSNYSIRMHMAYTLITRCDQMVICFEECMTATMMKEI